MEKHVGTDDYGSIVGIHGGNFNNLSTDEYVEKFNLPCLERAALLLCSGQDLMAALLKLASLVVPFCLH